MNPPSRRVAKPSLSLKRKETDHFRPSPVLTKSLKPPPPRNGSTHASKSPLPLHHPGSAKTAHPSFNPAQLSKPPSSTQAPKPNNLLLAGYMAHEFLTKGTILGDKIDPARAAALPLGPTRILSRSNDPSRSGEPSREADERYVDISSLLKTGGSHIPGIVNPLQLASYLRR